MADSDDYLENWNSSGDIWETVKTGSGTPSLNAGLFAKAGFGSGLMAILYAIIATLESWRQGVVNAVDGFWGFATDVVSVLYGGGTFVSTDGSPDFVWGMGTYVDNVFADAEAVLSNTVFGFFLAFAMVLGLALIVWGVRRYVL